jgi:hypothetical protein
MQPVSNVTLQFFCEAKVPIPRPQTDRCHNLIQFEEGSEKRGGPIVCERCGTEYKFVLGPAKHFKEITSEDEPEKEPVGKK